ncbi:MAG: hypothetical protein I3273_04040 [Candidatus Moeniiplasma glomeromycotorum]|nr:hypothetical protein [Candidatus Moeniiplasma glomeromycotorum]
MPFRTPSNQLTDKDIHNFVELWQDTIYFIPNINKYVDDNFTWIPTPGRFQKLIKEFRENEGGLNEQEERTEKILSAKPAVDEIWKKIVSWINIIHPNNTSFRETDPILRDLNGLHSVFELGSMDQQIKTLEEVLDKNNSLPDINQVKILCRELKDQWEKARPNSNICFIKNETGGNLTFVFQMPFGNFYDLKHFLFYKAGVFFEYKGHERVRMNYRNVIVHCERSIFWNDYEKVFLKGFSGIILNSPKLIPKDGQCGCPPFVSATNTMEFEFAWQPRYSLWQVLNPLGKPKGVEIKGKDLDGKEITLGEAFTTHELKKVDVSSKNWGLIDTIFYLLPRDYVSDTEKADDERGQAYQEYIRSGVSKKIDENGIKVKPLGEIRRKHERKNQSIWEVLKNGFKVKLKDGQKEAVDLTKPEYLHLHDHFNVQFFYNDKMDYQCRLSDLDLKNIEIHIIANPAGIVYTFHSKRISFKFSEQCKLIMEGSRIAKAGIELAKIIGPDAVKAVGKGIEKITSWIPIPGASQVGKGIGMITKWFAGKKTEIEKIGDSATRVMSEWDKTLESKTQDSKSGIDERQGERSAVMSGMSIPDTNAKVRYPSSIRGTSTGSDSKFSRTSEGTSHRQSKDIGQGDTSSSSQARSTSVSYSFSPAQSTTAVLGVVPSMMATSNLDNDYSLLDFILHKKSPAFKIRIQYNKPQISHYVQNLRMRRKEGHKLVCKTVFANLTDVAGFHKYIPHMIEGDTNGFFADLYSRGVEQYKNTPKEIWNLDLGEMETPKDNMIISKFAANYTAHEELIKEIGSTDEYSHEDEKVWLNYVSYLKKEGESDDKGRNTIKELAESSNRPFSGYQNTSVCGGSRIGCKAAGKTARQCYETHNPEDTHHPDGDVMFAHTTDQSILECDWTFTATTYWKIVREMIPAKEGRWEDNEGKRGNNWYNTREEAEKYADRVRGWGKKVRNVRVEFSYRQGNTSYGETEEVSESEYNRRRKSGDYRCWTSERGAEWGTRKTGTKPKGGYNRKGVVETGEFEDIVESYKISSGTTIYKTEKINKEGKQDCYWVWWEELFGQREQDERISDKKYINLKEYEEIKRSKPSDVVDFGFDYPDEFSESLKKGKPASWKFAMNGNWRSHTINLDSSKKYSAHIYTFHNGKGSKEITDPGTNDGSPWQCWLEQRGNWIGIVFNRAKVVSISVGDADDLGGGMEYTNEVDNAYEIATDNTWTDVSEGVQQVQAENQQEQLLSLEQLNEALHMPQQELTQEYTEEQIRQIETERAIRAEQQRKAQKSQEDEEWDELDNRGNRTRNK